MFGGAVDLGYGVYPTIRVTAVGFIVAMLLVLTARVRLFGCSRCVSMLGVRCPLVMQAI